MHFQLTNNEPSNSRPASASPPDWARLVDEAELFRRRALECRQAAQRTPDGPWRLHLESIAEELEREAEWIVRGHERPS